MMETLVSLRSLERIVVKEGHVDDKSKIAYVTVELQKREGCIIVFSKHSDEIVDMVLNEINPEDSGYVFFASELEVDPVNNAMVPRHRLATEGELDDLIRKRIPANKLPVLRMLDPIRRWNNFAMGAIVAVDRPDGTYFRVVNTN